MISVERRSVPSVHTKEAALEEVKLILISSGICQKKWCHQNTMSGYSMDVTACTSEHSMEHAMSAYHQHLPHGAGLIILSREYFSFWISKHVCDDRFVDMEKFLGKEDSTKPEDFITALTDLQKACGVADLKMLPIFMKEHINKSFLVITTPM